MFPNVFNLAAHDENPGGRKNLVQHEQHDQAFSNLRNAGTCPNMKCVRERPNKPMKHDPIIDHLVFQLIT